MTGATVWLTGLPSSGKSTIAAHTRGVLEIAGFRTEVLDGDAVRSALSPELGYTREERDLHVTRIGWLARLLAAHDVIVLVAVIAPYLETRSAVRDAHGSTDTLFLEVYVDTPVDECARRDVKGLYAAHRAGSLGRLTGVDDPYEVPIRPDITINTSRQSAGECATALVDAILRHVPRPMASLRTPIAFPDGATSVLRDTVV